MAEQAVSAPLWLTRVRTVLSGRNTYFFMKRTLDLLIAVVGLFFTAWLIVLAWLALTVTLRRDALQLEPLTGRNGEPFFRASLQLSLEADANQPLSRVARAVQRARLDKLVQLVNLLKGELSLVGPEPEVLAYAATLEGRDREVLTLQPGMTGAGSQKGETLEEKLALERGYLEQRSFFRDLHHLRWWLLF